MDGFKSRLNKAKAKVNELEDISVEIIQSKNREKWWEENDQSLRGMWDNIKYSKKCAIGVSEGEDRQNGQKIYILTNIDQNLPNLVQFSRIPMNPRNI